MSKMTLLRMAEGNPGALTCMIEMINSYESALEDIEYLERLEIYGSKIYMLWNDCCGRDIAKLRKTLKYFKSGIITKSEIHENLNRIRAIPFIKEENTWTI